MCKPQGRCGKDHFAAESGGRNRTAARKEGMYHRCGPAGEHDDGGVRGGNGKSSPGCHARECAAGNHVGQTPGAEASHVVGQGGCAAGVLGPGGHGSDHEYHPREGISFQGNNKRPGKEI